MKIFRTVVILAIITVLVSPAVFEVAPTEAASGDLVHQTLSILFLNRSSSCAGLLRFSVIALSSRIVYVTDEGPLSEHRVSGELSRESFMELMRGLSSHHLWTLPSNTGSMAPVTGCTMCKVFVRLTQAEHSATFLPSNNALHKSFVDFVINDSIIGRHLNALGETSGAFWFAEYLGQFSLQESVR